MKKILALILCFPLFSLAQNSLNDANKFQTELVSFYENNIFKYEVVTDDAEIVEEKEYEVIRHRINTINKLLGDT